MDRYGAMCPQRRPQRRKDQLKSEDCLFLNVWTPSKNKMDKLPVMVWIHGGGFTDGSGNLTSGKPLAERGVVLVSINYRLGPIGFFAHPLLTRESGKGISGNYGILDMVSALEWVQRNIEQFGGDPDNVSIFGESAGGTGVYILCSSELTNGLFHKAIAESPWVTDGSISPLSKPSFTRESVEATGVRIAHKFFDRERVSLENLRGLDAFDLVAQTANGYRLPAAIDGHVLTDNPANLFEQGVIESRPLIVGSNTDEGTMFSQRADKMSVGDYRSEMEKEFKTGVKKVLELYPADTQSAIKNALNRSINDVWFAQPSRWMATHMSKKNADTYLYHFAHQSMRWPAGGSSHAAELAFVFGTLEEKLHTPSYKKLSDAMITYWTQFAKTGNPNSSESPKWPKYTKRTDQNIRLDKKISVEVNYLKDNLDALEEIYNQIGKYK